MCAQRKPAVKEAKAPAPAKNAPGKDAADKPKPAKASAKAGPEEKPQSGFSKRFGTFATIYRDTRAELKKVTWPDKDTTRNLTVVVIAISVVLGALLGGIDALLVRVIEAL
jgi:preprotein translocase subunit SecE